ncbi:hypothetical protein [Lysobacter sp. K5869]|uniref:hypothetical protein n=1 Tax=Lysobacter sp. K5869 TaxID=2820808 RepID=UPI0021019F5B|nr:hypothetical protein [Lysobacter sp. K5869]
MARDKIEKLKKSRVYSCPGIDAEGYESTYLATGHDDAAALAHLRSSGVEPLGPAKFEGHRPVRPTGDGRFEVLIGERDQAVTDARAHVLFVVEEASLEGQDLLSKNLKGTREAEARHERERREMGCDDD